MRQQKRKMCRRFSILIVMMLCVPGIARTESPVLEFVKQIGIGWQPEKYGWMSFVSFSPDGTMVASDGPTSPDDMSGDLSVWSFPGGKLIKRLPVRPTAISGDWKYYASYNAVGEMESGKAVISLEEGVRAIHTF